MAKIRNHLPNVISCVSIARWRAALSRETGAARMFFDN